MLEKSCGWWIIWYLLFFCHGGAEGQLQWVVKEKVTDYGQNLTLFCPVENCCSEAAGWSVGTKSIIIDVKTFSNDPKMKYNGTYNTDGFGVVIRNLSEGDLNVTYHCIYGFDESTPKYLLHGDVFKENVPDKDKENDTTATIAVPIVVTMVLVGIGIVAYYVYKSRTNEETEKFNGSDIQMENQQDFGDGVVLHVEEDQDAAEEFMTNMRTENPNLKIEIISYKNLLPGTSVLESAAKVFDSHIYLFVFITQNFVKATFEKYCSEIALIETLIKQGKNARLIPVKTDNTCDFPIFLVPLIPLKYCNYLEAKKLQQGPDRDFIRCFRDLITNGRQKYL